MDAFPPIPSISLQYRYRKSKPTYMVSRPSTTFSILIEISWPFSSFAFVTLKTDKTDDAKMKSIVSTKWRAGQIRLPAPNARAIVGSSRKVPSALRNRSGLNVSGSGYSSGLCSTALEIFQKNLGRSNFYDPLPTMHWHTPVSLSGGQISSESHRHMSGISNLLE